MSGVKFFVPGKPAPGGSKKSFVNPRTGKVVTLDDAKDNAGWRAVVALYGRQAMGSRPLFDEPLAVMMAFVVARPKHHYRTGKNAARLKPGAPDYPAGKPDVLKLARSTEDALTNVVWKDDATTVTLILGKGYAGAGDTPGVHVTVAPAELVGSVA